jgi:hypothetical protein
VAVWVERADNSVAATLSVWYDAKMRDAEGTKWLKDMRQWWRRTGRELTMPIDGVTQPTKPVGKHALSVAEGKNPLPQLAPGQYKLMVEAAREVGGRELVSIPFEWPVKQATSLSANGSTELGAIKLELKPDRSDPLPFLAAPQPCFPGFPRFLCFDHLFQGVTMFSSALAQTRAMSPTLACGRPGA